jgi:hypothetical protein
MAGRMGADAESLMVSTGGAAITACCVAPSMAGTRGPAIARIAVSREP